MSGEGNSNDGLWMLFFIFAFIFVAGWGIWTLFKPQLLQGLIWVRSGEMAVASLYTPDDKVIYYTEEGKKNAITFGEARDILDDLTPEIILNEQVDGLALIHAVSAAALKPLLIPFGLGFIGLILLVMFRGPTSHHRKHFNLDALIKAQSQNFPVIQPIVDFNPLDMKSRSPGDPVPAELPLFAEALGPEEWIAFNKIPNLDGEIDRNVTALAFEKQLGKTWAGVAKIPDYMQVLMAAFCLKAARKRGESDEILSRIAACWDSKTGLKLSRDSSLLSDVRKILRNKDISGETIGLCNRHAYVTTAMLRGLFHARSQGGVLAPAQFIWLRGHDRALWYPMNNLGRQAFHAEAIGAMNHFQAEKRVGRPIPRPYMNDAVNSLLAHMKDKDAHPIPQLDFSMVKNADAPQKNKGVMKPAGT